MEHNEMPNGIVSHYSVVITAQPVNDLLPDMMCNYQQQFILNMCKGCAVIP